MWCPESWVAYAFRARAAFQKQLYITLHPCTAQHLLRVEGVIGISFRISNRIGTSIGLGPGTGSNIGAGIRIGI